MLTAIELPHYFEWLYSFPSYLLLFYRYFKTIDVIYVCFAIASNDAISNVVHI